MRLAYQIGLFLVLLFLAGCAHNKQSRPDIAAPTTTKNPAQTNPNQGRYSQDQDGGPSVPPIDVSKIPEPIPKAEPLSRYGNKSPYTVLGKTYKVLPTTKGYVERGIASWYGTKFQGHETSSYEKYDMYAFTAANKALPLPSYARVTNLENGKSVVVRVNDRGPFHENRVIDLSYAAAVKIGVWPKGTGLVEVRGIDVEHFQAETTSPNAIIVRSGTPQIYLQLGAYANRGNAEHVANVAKKGGVEDVRIETADLNGHSIHRVRIGPLASVEMADALTPRIRKLGLDSPSVAIE